MPKGLLVVTATLDPAQFWPAGESDADTVNVLSPSFQYSSTGKTQDLKPTHAFDNAKMKGQKNTVVYKNKLKIRLQGVDALELHFAALLRRKPGVTLKNNGTKFRQYLGETSTVALGTFLKNQMKGTVCRVETRVDKPGEVYDMYGRFVGDVFVKTASGWVDINQWLAKNGWAFPTYYNSMSPDEINTIQKLAEAARKAKKGIWAHETRNTALWDSKLVYRPKGTPEPANDVGSAMMPKIFRRRTRYEVSRLNDLPDTSGFFKDYLASLEDGWVTRAVFLANPNMKSAPKGQKNLAPLVDVHELFADSPGDLVFFEADSKLIGGNGQPVTKWF